MHRRTLLSVALSLPLLSACSPAESESAVGGTTDLVLATLFVNASAEYDAACRTVYAAATAALEADPQLAQLRFRLVPRRLSEEDFWQVRRGLVVLFCAERL